jgi:putative oxidoreductase
MVEQRDFFPMQPIGTRRLRRKTNVAGLARLRVTFLLRFSLAAVFFWFGMLKLAGVSPAVELLRNSIPFLATSPYIELLGLAEIVIAIGLVIERLTNQAATLMILHLFCTLSVAIIAPTLVFAPAFPVLTMDGEFLAKNFVLITAGLVVISSRNSALGGGSE